jgi:hypothetical protein
MRLRQHEETVIQEGFYLKLGSLLDNISILLYFKVLALLCKIFIL